MGGTKGVRTEGGLDVTVTLVGVEIRVEVAGSRRSAVIVGTGVSRAACIVVMRSCGAPVAGLSQMICIRMFSFTGGMEDGWTSAL